MRLFVPAAFARGERGGVQPSCAASCSPPHTTTARAPLMRRLVTSVLAAVAAVGVALPSALTAQGAGGTVVGRVTDAATGQPIQQARVLVQGTQNGALTAENGRYSLRVTTSGAVVLEVSRIGYEAKRVTVTVSGTAPITQDVALSQAAFSLSAVVTTVTGQQRKVELANATATVNVSEKIAELPVSNLSQVLQGRAAGVNVVSSGEPGVGARIRIRGQSSISLSNEPVVIIDGVRVASSSGSSALGVGGQSPSRLDDINPEEIESIEIVKGPSAATLYGTEAAAGVINITTKRGKSGRTSWSFYSENGLTQDPRRGDYPLLYNAWGRNATTRNPQRCDIVLRLAGTCTVDSITSGNILNIDSLSPIDIGQRGQFGAQVSGGSDRVQYFVSGEMEREDGIYKMPAGEIARLKAERGVSSLPQDQLRPQGLARNNLRLNLNAQVAPKANLALSSGYVNSDIRRVQNNDNANGLMVQAMGGAWNPSNRDGRGVPLPGMFSFPFGDVFSRVTNQELNRFINSATLRYDPTDWLNVRATVGYDYSMRDELQINRFDQGIFQFPGRNGQLNSARSRISQGTVDLGSTITKSLTSWLGTKTSVGMQFIRNDFEGTTATGENLPPGAITVTAASIRNATQTFDYARTLGFYLEEQLSIRDRLFLTAALRRDAASAFGSDARSIYYPKFGASWLISDESFMPRADWLQSLRLRATYGASGQLPGLTDAIRFYQPFPATLTGGDVPSVTLAALGNSNLKPEFGAEVETGFDATLFNGKSNLVVTYYNKNTRDALVSRDLAPSLAGITSRFENIGNVRNSGFELEFTQRLIERKNIFAEVLLNGSTNRNELLTLGEGVRPLLTGAGSRITMRQQVGYPLYGMWGRTYTYNDANNDGALALNEITFSDSAEYIAPSFPTLEFAVAPTIELFDRKLRMTAQIDHKSGMRKFNNTLRHMCQGGNSCRGRLDPSAPLEMQAAGIAANAGIFTGMYEDGSFTRLREVALSYQMPQSWARALKAQRWNLIFTGRNLAVWTPFTGLDPETTQSNTDNRGNEEFFSTPLMRTWTLRMNFNY
ncbi:SusC/RagA family TonB-linked outer membrane protein [Gemmatimonas sp.]|uniref:SusC/RagA family TonB-linked outer membrane protein n=1 Tax=Gemmatimonas sp. TaxID=1962908 RepID=UPI0025BB718A|nr:SusC/RagA family TonB-linked outer membrane protein [Gemmatimonas sp.]MCA2990469.1 SusC/RagA family TonB-linked outer membrane protein [Gemmatimonas sp.]